ncbi:semaphorin-3E-like [Petaurus breviceps papuanus]|uniref:semaphorin-3E-like n=1 Tax=Petaurus breviceps papuanus TaxID=3040969 RepID=UPI0036DAB3EE
MASAGHIIISVLGGLLLEFGTGGHATDTTHPRLRLSHKELWDLNRTSIFHSPFGFLDLHVMLLDEYQERLFVGGRDLMYSLNLDGVSEGYREIHWPSTVLQKEECMMKGKDESECANFVRVLHHYNRTHLLACGTGAFDPLCAFIRVGHQLEGHLFQLESHRFERGRGRCPFDPNSSFTSTLIGSELFSGLYSDYWGRDAAVFRSLGRMAHIRTEHDDERLLKEPKFVGSYMIPDNEDRDDNKVYFFFTEKALESENNAHTIYTRVGRVCANDVGGQRILVNKWSSFLKARLVCSVPGINGIDTHFDELEDIFLLHTRDNKNPVIFGLFNTTRKEIGLKLRPPRPLPEDGEPLEPILSCAAQDFSKSVFTISKKECRIAEPDSGIVLKVITIYNQETESMEEVILEELQVFKVPVPIISMEISSKRQQLYIGSESAVAQIRFHQCDMYGTACADCCLARDPYCAWDGISCSRYYPTGTHAKRRFRRQDVRHGNAAQQCFGQQFVGEVLDKTEERLAYGIEYNSTLLECTPRSLQAKVIWFVQKARETRKEEVKTDDRVVKMDLGLLFLRLHKMDAGTYFCQTVEHGFVHTVRKITLEVVEEERVEEMFNKDYEEEVAHKMPCPAHSSIPQGSKPWYKEFLQLIGYSNFQRVEEYCEKVWCTDKKRKKLKMSPSKWKYSTPQEKKLRAKSEHYRLPRHALDF